jgi:hypothetical protein
LSPSMAAPGDRCRRSSKMLRLTNLVPVALPGARSLGGHDTGFGLPDQPALVLPLLSACGGVPDHRCAADDLMSVPASSAGRCSAGLDPAHYAGTACVRDSPPPRRWSTL